MIPYKVNEHLDIHIDFSEIEAMIRKEAHIFLHFKSKEIIKLTFETSNDARRYFENHTNK